MASTLATASRTSPAFFAPVGRVGARVGAPEAVARIREFLRERPVKSPCLVIDLATVRERFWALAHALPQAGLYYAVKANPAPEVMRELAALGSSFDVASVPEIELCLAEGAKPEDLSYGNTIKKPADIARAYALGVRLYTTDSEADLEALAAHAPGSSVFCRIQVTAPGAVYPFGSKFGCAPEQAERLLAQAAQSGLTPAGVSFHIGSQQLDPHAWDAAIAEAARITARLAARGVRLPMVNLGGGLPGSYDQPCPPLERYAGAICESMLAHFGAAGLDMPKLVLEPGRFLVADAGLLRSEVVLVSRKSPEAEERWVYVDVGRYQGLAETEGECIAYLLAVPEHEVDVGAQADAASAGPVFLAGPTCDSDDVIYQRTVYRMPSALRAGDHVDFLSTGAYTASYSSIAFNGFPPLQTLCI